MLRGTDSAIAMVKTQQDFDALFTLLFHHDRKIVMRAADAVEKITKSSPAYLASHKNQLLELSRDHATIEVKWHLAQLLPRLLLERREFDEVWARLKYWSLNRNESKIVRVNALQSLFELMCARGDEGTRIEFNRVVQDVSRDHIPSLDARIRKLRQTKSKASQSSLS